MADIRVEKRDNPSLWPWIIGILVLALVIWGVAEVLDSDAPEYTEVETIEQPAAVPAPAIGGEVGEEGLDGL